eukprot:gene25980-11666_t
MPPSRLSEVGLPSNNNTAATTASIMGGNIDFSIPASFDEETTAVVNRPESLATANGEPSEYVGEDGRPMAPLISVNKTPASFFDQRMSGLSKTDTMQGEDRPSRQRITFGNAVRTTKGATKDSFAAMLNAASAPLSVAKVNTEGINVNKGNVESRIMKVLDQFDVDGNGTLDIQEVTALVEHLLSEQETSKFLKWFAIALIVFTVVLLAAMTGLIYAIVYAMKDTEVTNNILVTKSGETIQVGSTDFRVDINGLMQPRYADSNIGQEIDPSSSGALRVSAYAGVAQGLHSEMKVEDLMELNYLYLTSSSRHELALKVNGVARAPFPQSLYGSVLFIYTAAGTINLDGELITFEQGMTSMFTDASTSDGRRLLQDTITGMTSMFTDAGFTVASTSDGRRLLQDTIAGGRYNRPVEILPLPAVPNSELSKAWYIEASSKEEAMDATALLTALDAESADESKYDTMWQDCKPHQHSLSPWNLPPSHPSRVQAESADESKYNTMWQDFKQVVVKTYPTMQADLVAFRIFIKNLLRIVNANNDDSLPYWTGVNKFSDMEYEEFRKTVLMVIDRMCMSIPCLVQVLMSIDRMSSVYHDVLMQIDPVNRTELEQSEGFQRRMTRQIEARRHLVEVELAKAVDWVAAGKDQGICGSCWAFAGAAAIESAILISNPDIDPESVDLSEENLVNCVNYEANPTFISMGCLGGDPIETLIYAFEVNVTSNAKMPYTVGKTGVEKSCDREYLKQTKVGEVAKSSVDSNYVYPWNKEVPLIRAVMQQPVAAYFMVDSTFLSYSGGIYTPTTCSTWTNHNFIITGYNTNGPIPYWIIKNQWGEGWGEKGYARIKMTGDGEGPCGMYTIATYPSLKFDLTVGTPKKTVGKVSGGVNETGGGAEGVTEDAYSGYGAYESYGDVVDTTVKKVVRKKKAAALRRHTV